MGCFNYTCALSRLPISDGDQVRYLLLASNPYDENKGHQACMPFDWWVPRTFPVRAKYDDYGSVEEVQDPIGTEVWLEALKLDLIPQGRGDNSIHDVPTSTDMNWGDFLNAVGESRVQVGPLPMPEDVRKLMEEHGSKQKHNDGFPTLESVEEILLQAGVTKSDGYEGDGKPGFMMDELEGSEVRIRWHGQENQTQKLEELQDILALTYAAVVTAGSGPYASTAELLVFPQPGAGARRRRREKLDRSSTLSQMMIREDVWQKLLNLPVLDDGFAPANYRKAVRKLYEESVALVGSKTEAEIRRDRFLVAPGQQSRHTSMLEHDRHPITSAGLTTHWDLLWAKGHPVEEVSSLVDGIGEFLYVIHTMSRLRYLWVPSSACGGQAGEYDKHALFHAAMGGVAADYHLANEDED